MRRNSIAFLLLAMAPALFSPAAEKPCPPRRHLLTMPEIASRDGLLRGVLILSDQERGVPAQASGTKCDSVPLRYIKGRDAQGEPREWPSKGEPLPGPTLRARVGDLVQLTFLNQIDTSNFSSTLDEAEKGTETGCDEAFAVPPQAEQGGSKRIYPFINRFGKTPGDVFPNCLHGSSTANIHFHGTHTTPNTTGDNVLLYVRPALRLNGGLAPSDELVAEQFEEVFRRCRANGSPQRWDQMPQVWQEEQKKLLQIYDRIAPFEGEESNLPADMHLWPKNEARLAQGLWPQFNIGAFPYCFELPKHDPSKVRMGQAPGTHWYHAHKHGSTALNVANGMAGAFVIEGEYDDALRHFYRQTPERRNWGLEEKVLVIQQLESTLNLLSPRVFGTAPLSVNGRLNPVVTMKPNQVQLWRVINASHRSLVRLTGFTKKGAGLNGPAWRQIAQDGVQFSFANYQRIGTVDATVPLAAANRADLLMRAPRIEGDYELQIVESVSDVPGSRDKPAILLTVRVRADDKPISPAMSFITNEADFPRQPEFLADIEGPFRLKRELSFDTTPRAGREGQGRLPHHEIDGEQFDGDHVNQTMVLDTAEEWTVLNKTPDIAHPFHIHINPFQVVEVFQPNDPGARDTKSACYADPTKPATWKQCNPLTPPFVWWDVFAIPTARQDKLPASVCTQKDQCPADIRPYTACSGGTCTVTIPGYFKMRSRFVDYPGQFVLHCHILAHEDRGMMQLVQVVEKPMIGAEHH